MKIKTLAHVKSSTDSNRQYAVILRGGMVQCQCASHFFSADRRVPCKHIKAMTTLDRVAVDEMVQKRVTLTDAGIVWLSRWRGRHGLPLVRTKK